MKNIIKTMIALATTLIVGVLPTDGIVVDNLFYNQCLSLCFAESNHAGDDAALQLPLRVCTHTFTDSDAQGELLRTQWSSIEFYGNAEPFQNLADALAKFNDEESKSFDSSRKEMLVAAEKYRSMMQRNGTIAFTPHWLKKDLHIKRADAKVVSILKETSGYMGGAHGFNSVTGINFNAQTGEKIKLADVFGDLDKLTEAIQTKLLNNYPNATFAKSGVAEMKKKIEQMVRDETVAWTMDQSGLSFYFNPYTIDNFAEGIISTTIFVAPSELFKRANSIN